MTLVVTLAYILSPLPLISITETVRESKDRINQSTMSPFFSSSQSTKRQGGEERTIPVPHSRLDW